MPERSPLSSTAARAVHDDDACTFVRDASRLWRALAPLMERVAALDAAMHRMFEELMRSSSRGDDERRKLEALYVKLQGLGFVSRSDAQVQRLEESSIARLLELERVLAERGTLPSGAVSELVALRESMLGPCVAEYHRHQRAREVAPVRRLAEALALHVAYVERGHAFASSFAAGEIGIDEFVRGPAPDTWRDDRRVEELLAEVPECATARLDDATRGARRAKSARRGRGPARVN